MLPFDLISERARSSDRDAFKIRPAHALKIEQFAGAIDLPVGGEGRGVVDDLAIELLESRLCFKEGIDRRCGLVMVSGVRHDLGIERDIDRHPDMGGAQDVALMASP